MSCAILVSRQHTVTSSVCSLGVSHLGWSQSCEVKTEDWPRAWQQVRESRLSPGFLGGTSHSGCLFVRCGTSNMRIWESCWTGGKEKDWQEPFKNCKLGSLHLNGLLTDHHQQGFSTGTSSTCAEPDHVTDVVAGISVVFEGDKLIHVIA